MKCVILAILSIIVLESAFAKDWYENAVFYQIYPKSFKDSNGDGIGDLKGITSKLGHLKDLGIDGAWLSPIFKSPQKDGGYDIADFQTVDPIFGTNEDLEELFREAKKIGIKIILDFVPNHTSDQHEWFQKSIKKEGKYKDYYVWKDAKILENGTRSEPNNWIAVFHTKAWEWNEERQQYYLHQFAKEQPDLNFRNIDVKEELNAMIRFWLDKGADGFRIDAINHAFEVEDFSDEEYIDPNGDRSSYDNLKHTKTMNLDESYDLVYKYRDILDAFTKDKKTDTKFMMTEAYATLEQQVRWYGNSNGSILGAHMPFNFALVSDINKNSDATAFEKATQKWLDSKPSYGIPNWVLGNHDQSRLGTRYGEERHESLAFMTMLLPGINVVYYGEEILMLNNDDITWEETQDPRAKNTNETVYKEHSRDPARTPFQWDGTANAGFSSTTQKTWLPINKNYKERNLELQKKDPSSTFNLYKTLISLRKSNKVLQDGKYEGKALNENVYAFSRYTDKDTIVVAINLRNTNQTIDLTKLKSTEKKTKGKVLITTRGTGLKAEDDKIDVTKFTLNANQAIAFEVSGSNTLTIMGLLVMFGVVILRFFN